MYGDTDERREDFGIWIRRQREDRGFGIDKAARMAGVTATTLRRIELGDVPSIQVARSIARALELDLSDVFRRVGYPLGLWHDRRQGSSVLKYADLTPKRSRENADTEY